MQQSIFMGVSFIAVSAFHLIPAILSGEIPARWPVKPLTRSGKPKQFWATISVFAATGFVGLVMLLWVTWSYFFNAH